MIEIKQNRCEGENKEEGIKDGEWNDNSLYMDMKGTTIGIGEMKIGKEWQ